MSAFVTNETQITDIDCLKKALEKKGYTDVETHSVAQNLVGYHGDVRKDTAEVIIRRKHIGSASNDIGFKKNSKGTFDAIISQFDSGRHNKTWLNDLKKEYAVAKTQKTMKQLGATQLSKAEKNGKTVMTYVVNKI